MLDDPRNWTSNIEWSNFYWENNVLGIYKIISDRLLSKLTPELINLYSSNGYHFSSSSALSSMEKLDSNNLLLDRVFNASFWIIVENYENSTNEKLHVILNRKKFEITYTDQNEKVEKIEIPYFVQSSDNLTMLETQVEYVSCQIKELENLVSETKDSELMNEIDKKKLFLNGFYLEIAEENKILEEQKNQILDLEYWGKIIKNVLSADLPIINNQNKTQSGLVYHIIEINFSGELNINITHQIH